MTDDELRARILCDIYREAGEIATEWGYGLTRSVALAISGAARRAGVDRLSAAREGREAYRQRLRDRARQPVTAEEG